jgi:hypothetical protein
VASASSVSAPQQYRAIVRLGETLELTANVTDGFGTASGPVLNALQWVSRNSSVGTIESTGLATATTTPTGRGEYNVEARWGRGASLGFPGVEIVPSTLNGGGSFVAASLDIVVLA